MGSSPCANNNCRICSASGVPPGSRVRTGGCPAAASISAMRAMLVDLPTPSPPSTVMNFPRLLISLIRCWHGLDSRLGGLRRARTVIAAPLPHLIFLDRALMVGQRRGELMAAVATGDKIQRVALLRLQCRANRRRSRQRNRCRRQPRSSIGVERIAGIVEVAPAQVAIVALT